ncbi:MAG: large conductance mechanosensitive channel protein MscL [Firmicutes bacterium]|nr:large conductance mechanosensitive channel protein MscL [Bacillota bacterium]
MKKFMTEFKAFIAKGDVMSMAVGIIIGGAFTAIVQSLVNDVITPLLGIIMGGINFTGIILTVGEAQLLVGNFIQAVISFLLTALVLFFILKAFNAFKKKEEEKPAAPAEPPADVQLLTEIRDLLKNK